MCAPEVVPMKTFILSLPFRVWVVQLLIALLVICSMAVFGGQAAEKLAWSAIAASLVVLIPNAVFAWYASDGRQNVDLSARLASRPFVKGSSLRGSLENASKADPKVMEAQGQARRILVQQYIKMLLTAVLMVLAFVLLKPEPLGFFCALVVVQAGYFAAPLVGGK